MYILYALVLSTESLTHNKEIAVDLGVMGSPWILTVENLHVLVKAAWPATRIEGEAEVVLCSEHGAVAGNPHWDICLSNATDRTKVLIDSLVNQGDLWAC